MIQAQLVYLTAQQKVMVLPLTPDGASIGRGSGCTIVATDAQVSQLHVVLRLIGEIWHIEDQRSTNGTLVNGSRIHLPTRLRHLDVITCGTLQLRFLLVSGSEQATLAERPKPTDGEPVNDIGALRSELAKLKKERDELLGKLEQEDRELSGANAENRQLRQEQLDVRAELAALRKQLAQGAASQAAAQVAERAALSARDLQDKRLCELGEHLRTLQAEAQTQIEARHSAEEETRRLNERVVILEEERDGLTRAKEEALAEANRRQLDLDELRRMGEGWERYKEQRDADLRVNAERIRQLLSTTDEQSAELRAARKELEQLRQRQDEKNAQHRGLRSEFDRLTVDFERYRAQVQRQSERLSREKEALNEQIRTLQHEAEKAARAPDEHTERMLTQLVVEVSQSRTALGRENEALGQALTLALRWHVTASQANPIDPAGLRVRDALEKARSHAEQESNLLQQLASIGAPRVVSTPASAA